MSSDSRNILAIDWPTFRPLPQLTCVTKKKELFSWAGKYWHIWGRDSKDYVLFVEEVE